ncbi:MAG: zinc-dependent dehydrogenase [Candidatus Bathyarchaeia archaeon]|jgi:L-iditol 2-dehydrogenase
MKAVVISGRGIVELKELPTPNIGPGEVLVRMRACGVCGTDLEKIHGENITPPILGHEVAGEVEQTGEQVQEIKKGDRVLVHHHVSCRSCFYCKNGLETLCEAYPKSNLDPCGFADYFRVPSTLVAGGTVYRLPESMTYEEGSQVEPTACCIRALSKTGVKAGNSVAIFGVGPVGLMHLQLTKLYGAAPIIAIDILENRRELAARLGADRTLNPTTDDVPKTVSSMTQSLGVDYAIVATGSLRATEQAFSSIRKGGKVVLFGAPAKGAQLSIDISRLFLHEIKVESSYSTSETEMKMAIDLIEKKRVDPSKLITHRLPLAKALEAFSLAQKGVNVVKVVIENK